MTNTTHPETLLPNDIERARQILSELCHGTHRWTMHVPVRDDDSDMVLSRVIRAAENSRTTPTPKASTQDDVREALKPCSICDGTGYTWIAETYPDGEYTRTTVQEPCICTTPKASTPALLREVVQSWIRHFTACEPEAIQALGHDNYYTLVEDLQRVSEALAIPPQPASCERGGIEGAEEAYAALRTELDASIAETKSVCEAANYNAARALEAGADKKGLRIFMDISAEALARFTTKQEQNPDEITIHCKAQSGFVLLPDAAQQYQEPRDYLEDVSAIHALIGYVESLNVKDGITQGYLDRLKAHYIPNALKVLERRKLVHQEPREVAGDVEELVYALERARDAWYMTGNYDSMAQFKLEPVVLIIDEALARITKQDGGV